jgi:SAM-dependent methyltransferase
VRTNALLDKLKQWTRLAHAAPLPVKRALKVLAWPVDLLARWSWSRGNPTAPPLPPLRLRLRVGTGPSIDYYVRSGAAVADQVEAAVAGEGKSLSVLGPALDLGCGSGRVISHLIQRHPAISLEGCDVDAVAIRWASENLPGARFAQNAFEPPTPFEDEAFDLVYSISIFTHLTPALQSRWIGEVSRLLKPGSVAVLTTCGQRMLDHFQHGRATNNSVEFMRAVKGLGPLAEEPEPVFIPYRQSRSGRSDFPGINGEYGITFQTPAQTRRLWGSELTVTRIADGAINEGQDLVTLRRAT